jgi:hypothetical protein
MREYDEHIRHYSPMLQRVIILVAVIIAVPIVLWTITAFVRAYVAPPQIPTFRPLAANQAPANVQVAAQTANTATDARTLLSIKKPSDAQQAVPPMPQQAAAAAPPAPASAASADAVAPAALPGARTGVPPPPFAATRSTPSTAVAAPVMAAPAMAAPAPANIALASNAAGQTATPSAPSAMPMPAAAPSADNRFASTAFPQDQSAAADSADDVAAGTPLRGRIPLPTRRPHIAGLTAVAANMTADGAAPSMSARIPLPRARPSAAPEPGPVVTPYPVYDPSQIH